MNRPRRFSPPVVLRFLFKTSLAILLLTGPVFSVAGAASPAEGKKTMKLSHACLITRDLAGLRDFYREVLQVEPTSYQEEYVEFPTAGAILSLYKQESMDKTAPGAMAAQANKSLMLEFEVGDVDQEYARLKQSRLPIAWVMPPTTFPWGNRSIYFRDPEGNMLNFYSVVKSP
jgi:catechol 2,3-dioxygenase-like lactoylglutathione lyase family enzyme